MDQHSGSIEERQAMRRRFLEVVYAAAEGNTLQFVGMDVIGSQLGLSLQQAFPVGKYLSDKGLIRLMGGEGIWRITPAGVDAVERPASPGAVSAFGSVINNHIFAPNSTIGAIQQGATHSTQTVNNSQADVSGIAHLVDLILSDLPQSNLGGYELVEVEVSLETIKAQTKKPTPNAIILSEAAKSIRNVVEGMTAVSAQPTVLTMLHQLLHRLPHT